MSEQPACPASCPLCAEALAAGESPAMALLWCVMEAWWDDLLLPWAVEHMPDGADPLPAAWAACDGNMTMIEVALFGARRGNVPRENLHTPEHPLRTPASVCGIECARCAAHVRAHVAAPTFAELVAARGQFPGGTLR